jgi:hypothetical protein
LNAALGGLLVSFLFSLLSPLSLSPLSLSPLCLFIPPLSLFSLFFAFQPAIPLQTLRQWPLDLAADRGERERREREERERRERERYDIYTTNTIYTYIHTCIHACITTPMSQVLYI